jgi:ubiquinone biosynthesis protein
MGGARMAMGRGPAVFAFIPEGLSPDQVDAMLRGPAGPLLRANLGAWVEQILPADYLVPEAYRKWRPLVRDAIVFTVSRLSDERLAPKIVEQIALPPGTPPEHRLLRMIAKVPALEKLGQTLARNRHLDRSLRRALVSLENGISDVTPGEIRGIIGRELGPRLQEYEVEIEPSIFSEASVSAVTRFTWTDPANNRREHGVFKVLKPYVPACFQEDLALLRDLAEMFGAKEYGFNTRDVPRMVSEIARLLEREVDYTREQAMLAEARGLYRGVAGVRVPRVFAPLSTSAVTALSQESGTKVTDAFHDSAHRALAGARLIEALVAIPLFSPEPSAIFHADPHAGNLLYDERTREFVILDWALAERLTRDERRRLVTLMLMLMLRDAAGVARAAERLQPEAALCLYPAVRSFLARLPRNRVPGSLDAVRLLDELAFAGVRFPAPLLMFRKALFTLDGVLNDVAGDSVEMDVVMARYFLLRWMVTLGLFSAPLGLADLLSLEWSALWYAPRFYADALYGRALSTA